MGGRTVRGATSMHCHHGNGGVIVYIVKGACISAVLISCMLKVELARSSGAGSVPPTSLWTISSARRNTVLTWSFPVITCAPLHLGCDPSGNELHKPAAPNARFLELVRGGAAGPVLAEFFAFDGRPRRRGRDSVT